ncbi:MAG: Crp/Fnr family transcriptional regulator [Flavobacteriales bacterium]|nr:Crp/Fnr family transcriptional regulator [Flavobacteriales bacterium]
MEEYALKHNLETALYRPGDPIFTEGGSVDGVYYIVNQYARIVRQNENGEGIFLFTAASRELIGLTSFLQREKRYSCSAIAGERSCSAIFFPRAAFSGLLQQQPGLRHELMQVLCKRIRWIEIRTKSMLHQNTDRRLTDTLLFLWKMENDGSRSASSSSARICYSPAELAGMIGTSEDYLKKRLGEMRSRGLIDFGKDWMVILNADRLRI